MPQPSHLIIIKPIYDDQSLPSYVDMLAMANHYEPIHLLTQHIQNGIPRKDAQLSRPLHSVIYERITALCNADLLKLYGASQHRFAEVITSPSNQLLTLKVRGHELSLIASDRRTKAFVSDQSGQYCPSCLRDQPYHRVQWWVAAVTACLKHQCLLVDYCPGCSYPVSIQAITVGHCSKCGFDLREAKAISVTGDEAGLLAQQIIQGLFGFAEMPLAGTLLPQLSRAAIYHSLQKLHMSMISTRFEWAWLNIANEELSTALVRPPLIHNQRVIPRSYVYLSVAVRAILNWPVEFYEILNTQK